MSNPCAIQISVPQIKFYWNACYRLFILSAPVLRQQRGKKMFASESVWPTRPKIPPTWPFTENADDPRFTVNERSGSEGRTVAVRRGNCFEPAVSRAGREAYLQPWEEKITWVSEHIAWVLNKMSYVRGSSAQGLAYSRRSINNSRQHYSR